MKIFKPLAEQGNAASQYNLAVMYYQGLGVPQDFSEAINWFNKAADQNIGDAQYYLGKFYYNGQGVPQDYVLAHMWFNLSAAKVPGGGGQAGFFRNAVEGKMSPAQIAEAQKLAREWKPRKP